MGEDWLDDFLAAETLPPSFRDTVERVCRPLAARAARLHARRGAAALGLCGAQGSGKSTIAAITARLLEQAGLRAVALSLDDFYLSREARARLAAQIHPLLATRGPPGTHDVALARETLARLGGGGSSLLPAFDKAADTHRPRQEWRTVNGPADIILFEGWCVGAHAQPEAALARPVNDLERYEDADGVWRGYVNAQLAGPYQVLFGRLDELVMLRAPSFDVVVSWRAEQERKLRARTGAGMTEGQIDRFVAHYERLTRWMLDETPARADWVVELDAARKPLHVADC